LSSGSYTDTLVLYFVYNDECFCQLYHYLNNKKYTTKLVLDEVNKEQERIRNINPHAKDSTVNS